MHMAAELICNTREATFTHFSFPGETVFSYELTPCITTPYGPRYPRRWNSACTSFGAVFIATIGGRPSPTDMSALRIVAVSLTIWFVIMVAAVTPAKAHQRLAGNYECVRLEFAGKSAPCQSPPLVLNEDGSYDIWGEHGTYQVVEGRWLVLSHSKRRGRGHFVNAHDVVFEYRVDGQICQVTFRRIFEAPPGYWWN